MNRLSLSYENPLRVRFGEDYFKRIPRDPGVYVFLDARGEPLYIGKADCLRKRLMSYQAAKPGRVQDHILEMIELARGIRWELHESGERALQRESELIRAVRPPFNIAGAFSAPSLFWGVRFGSLGKSRPSGAPSSGGGLVPVDFRLSHAEIGDGHTTYGCFQARGKTKAGYSALLRLLFVSVCERERYHLPARICRSSPPYVYRAQLPSAWREPLEWFLEGEDRRLLHLITHRLLEKTNVPAMLYAPLQRDLNTLKEFFEVGPEATRRVARLTGLRRRPVSQARMERFYAEQLKSNILRQSGVSI